MSIVVFVEVGQPPMEVVRVVLVRSDGFVVQFPLRLRVREKTVLGYIVTEAICNLGVLSC